MKLRTVVFYLGLVIVAVAPTLFHKVSKIRPDSSNVQNGGKSDAGRMRIVESYGKLPLNFEANKGQTDPEVKFLSRGSGYTLFLAPTEAVLALRKATASSPRPKKTDRVHAALEPEAVQAQAPVVLRMKLIGSNSAPRLVGLDERAGKSNYFIGNDPKKWRTNVPNYSRVRYEDVYAGVDLIYYGSSQGQLEYDFVVAPGAVPGAITLGFEGAEGFAIDPQGNLILSMDGGEVSLHKPVVYQEVDGVRREIQGGYVLKERNRVGFEVATYDASKPLVIDPTLAYSTYLGGSGLDLGDDIAVDSSGHAYVIGGTGSTNFPTTIGAFQTVCGGCGDAFVTKFNPTGSTLVYSTYLGGNAGEDSRSIAVDGGGNAYLTGGTQSTNFPLASPFQAAFVGGRDAFVTKLNPTGSALVYSTYLGGNGGEETGFAIAVDSGGNAYVTGGTDSTNFPTASPFQAAFGGGIADGFVTKFNPTGSALVYSTYLGGNGDDEGFGIAVDSSGSAYVTGDTDSTNFPTASPLQAASGGNFDAFMTKFNASGSVLLYSTYLGGNGDDFVGDINVDSSGSAYVAGDTTSTNFPTATPFQATLGGGTDAFVTKLNSTGSALVYSTYLGGSGDDGGDIAVDSSGNAYVIGSTTSTNFPPASPIQAALGGGRDAFVTQFNPAGSALVHSTYLGGSGNDSGFSIAVDSGGNAYVTGFTVSTNFPTVTPFQAAFGGGTADAFVAKINAVAPPPSLPDLTVTKSGAPNPVIEGDNLTYTLRVTNNGPSGATGVTLTDPLPAALTFVSATPAQGMCSNASGTVTCNLGSMASAAQVAVTITGRPTGAASLSNTASVTAIESDPNPANNSATATGAALGFTLSNTSGTVTVNAGGTAQFTIRATPGVGGFPNAISFSSSNVPATMTGSFNPVSAIPGNSPLDVTFSLATMARSSVPPQRIPVQRPWPIVPLVGVFTLLLLWGLLKHQEPRLRPRAIALLGALLLAASLASCNGDKMPTGTPAGTYNVTVTAASGTASHATSVTLVVP